MVDGVVKSPIYGACPPQAGCSIFSDTRHTTCIASFLKKSYALYMNLFTQPSIGESVTFYEIINVEIGIVKS